MDGRVKGGENEGGGQASSRGGEGWMLERSYRRKTGEKKYEQDRLLSEKEG